MKKILFTLFFVLLLTACGNGGDNNTCSNIDDFVNGATSKTASSVWSCFSENQTAKFALFQDGTGISDTIGAFTWEETGCNEISYDGIRKGLITNISGSIESGVFVFTDNFKGISIKASCVLQK